MLKDIYIKIYCNTMNYDRIISEEINRFINEEILTERQKSKSKKEKDEPRDVGKKAKKLRNGRRGEFNFKRDRETNPNLTSQDAEDLTDILDSGYVNLAAVARDVYPDHTEEGAQSQLRKKVKGLTNDNGSKYKVKKKEAFKIRRSLARHLDR